MSEVFSGGSGGDEQAGSVKEIPHLWHAGPLQAAIEVPGVTDVLVNGPDEVWIDRGTGLERASVRFASPGEVRELAVRLASLGGRRLDDASPLVDARLPDGTRLHAALPPVVDGCAIISLRTVRSQRPDARRSGLGWHHSPSRRRGIGRPRIGAGEPPHHGRDGKWKDDAPRLAAFPCRSPASGSSSSRRRVR